MLNDAQKKVVGWRKGRLLVSAVPGSGKTRCVVHWIAELVNEGVDPERILAVTFTRKAAGEMNERLSELLSEKRSGKGVGGVRVGTFHSLCWDILKDGSPVEHWDFDSKDVMRRVLKQEILAWNQGAGMNWKDADLTKVEGWISYNKNELVGPEDAHHPYDTRFDEAYLLYEEERRSRQLLTFDDMLFHAAQFLLEDAEARERWSGRYSHVVIDEAQDTNHAQWVIMEILGEMSQVWAIVGDVDQAIYAWRGSYPERFSEFAEKFQAEIIGATLNYRSLPRIVESANRVIANNTKRIPQSAKPVREGEGVVQWRPVSDMDDEAVTVLQWIREMREDGRKWRDFAILVRTNAQSRAFEEVFLREKVPYVVVGGVDFWKRREIKDLVAYLRLADDLHDDAAFLQTVNRPFRYIGKVTLEKITDLAEARGKPMFWIAENVELGLRSNQVRSLKEYCSIVREAEESLKCGRSLTEVLSTVIRRVNYMGWLVRDMGSDTAENSRVSNTKELLRTLHRFESVEELRKYLRDLNAEKRKRSEGEEADVVRIMSIHKSKGLEFPVVFLAGACEDIIPHAKSQDVEEERRLFYVAMTRAMDALYVTSPVEAFVGVEKKALEPSRFVKEAGLLDSRASVVEG